MSIFQNPATKIPMSDEQIVRVNMEELEIGGRKSHLPAMKKASDMTVSHVPNAGSTVGK